MKRFLGCDLTQASSNRNLEMKRRSVMKKGIFHEQEPDVDESGSQQEDVKLSLNDIIARRQLQ